MPSPKPVPLELSDEERQVLTGWTRRRTTAQALALALRSRIVLECAKGRSNRKAKLVGGGKSYACAFGPVPAGRAGVAGS
jgi:hypothetical protein